MIAGELSNFAAYSFAPAILVTPLGALSVLISACLASLFLHEKLGRDGVVGCVLSLIGSIIIILHAPEEKEVDSINEMLGYALQPGMRGVPLFDRSLILVLIPPVALLPCHEPTNQPTTTFLGFLIYSLLVIGASLVLIIYYVPKIGKRNPLVYISICSLVGSITVMACKAFGIALKLTFQVCTLVLLVSIMMADGSVLPSMHDNRVSTNSHSPVPTSSLPS